MQTKQNLNLRSEEEHFPVDGGFLQSGAWADFQKALGRQVEELSAADGRVLMIKYLLPIVGGYFFIPRGPLFNRADLKEKQGVLDRILESGRKNHIGWIRVEPQTPSDLERIKKFCQREYLLLVKSKKNHEPAQTLMLDLTLNEEDLLAAMKPKTRYNIRLADKKGVEVFSSREEKYIDHFYGLVEETAKRDGVVAHNREYYRKMLQVIPEENMKLYLARYQGVVIAAAIVTFSSQVATYQHGASANLNRDVMAPYRLQWEAIREAKSQGCRRYDFGGIRLHEDPGLTSWAGITRFKLGFQPQGGVVNFPGCYDIILNRKRYWLYRNLQVVKDTKKKLTKFIRSGIK